ncbi:hypothetical protein KUTeg_013063 [Tegillarca granosa]|uniref:Uncharacterized protein n=1 Tax=Tegillarca granosa TaxID=220873 RepID=A0ABQ9ET08_TEGGR|nr:hypothetical protein KUTeg_013063 [Tegillarca granosa]
MALVASASNSAESCTLLLDNIQSSVHNSELSEQIEIQLEKIKNELKSEKNVDTIELTTTMLKKIVSNMDKLRSGKPLTVISGLCDIISETVSLVPYIGPLIASVFGLLSHVFGMFDGGRQNMSNLIQKIVNEALSRFEDTLLRRKYYGMKRAFSVSSAFLSGMDGGERISEHEIAAMGGCVPIYQGVTFLGILGSKLKEYSLEDGQHKKTMAFVKLYCELAFMRYSVLYQMFSVARSTGHSEYMARSIWRVIENDKLEDKDVLKFLTEPEYENREFFIQVNLFDDKWTVVKNFMSFINIEFQDLSFLANGHYHLSPQAWDYSKVYINFANIVQGCSYPDDTAKITFKETDEKNVFVIETKAYPGYKLFMVQDADGYVRASRYDKNGAEKWKIIRLADDKYLISNKKWPDWFMYMSNTAAGWLKGCKGYPAGEKGTWLIREVVDETI